MIGLHTVVVVLDIVDNVLEVVLVAVGDSVVVVLEVVAGVLEVVVGSVVCDKFAQGL